MGEDDVFDAVASEMQKPVIPSLSKKTMQQPSYKMIGESRIPISKQAGNVWCARRDAALKKRKDKGIQASWDEALRYYNNDQLSHRTNGDGDPDRAGNEGFVDRLNNRFSETENIVFANTSALIPTLYAKNPDCEITAIDEQDKSIATAAERLLNTLAARTSSPGLNLKNKARRAVIMTALTNRAYLEVGYTFRQHSNEKALQDLMESSKKLAEAKTEGEIRQAEQEIEAINNRIDYLQSSGPYVKYRRPHQVVVDPDSVDDNLADAQWVMICDFLPTEYIQAVYMTKESDGSYKSIYKPTHQLSINATDARDGSDRATEYTPFDSEAETDYKAYGYSDISAFRKGHRTLVWYVWDKVTRRLLMYNDKEWSWPIWVWDDPYKLDCFFPIIPFSFYTCPEGGEAKGEVTYYLDQQDAINQINSEKHRARIWGARNLFFDANHISEVEVNKFLSGPNGSAVGVKVPPDKKLNELLFSMPPPSAAFMQMYDKNDQYEAVRRLSSVHPVMQGAEFKTNTTNQAVQAYNSMQSTRLDEKIDAIEDSIGNLFWALLQLCLQFMSKEEVTQIIGQQAAQAWPDNAVAHTEISKMLQVRIVGGSSLKPTSQVKKKEALEMVQLLGQFASATPMAIVVALHVMERSFDELVIKEEDWQMILDSIEQQLKKGQTDVQGGAQQEGGAPQEENSVEKLIKDAVQLISQLPPEAQQALLGQVQQLMGNTQ